MLIRRHMTYILVYGGILMELQEIYTKDMDMGNSSLSLL